MKRQRYFTLAPSGLGEEGRQLHCCPGPHVPSLLWAAQLGYLISSHKAAYLSAQGSTCYFDPFFKSGFCCHSNICTLQLWPRDWAYYLSSALILTSYSQFSTPLWCQPKTPRSFTKTKAKTLQMVYSATLIFSSQSFDWISSLPNLYDAGIPFSGSPCLDVQPSKAL